MKKWPSRLFQSTFNHMKINQLFTVLVAGMCITIPSFAAEHVPDSLDLSDCRIISGKRYADAYRSTLANVTKRAKAGNLADQRILAAIATNRFACFQETVADSAGWTIISDDKKKDGSPGVVSTSTQLIDIETLKRNQEGLRALREAEGAAQSIANRDLAYRKIAARYVADYKVLFQPSDYADAYRNAVGVKAVACRNLDATEKGTNYLLCLDAKGIIADLHSLLPAEKRKQLEMAGLAWAEAFMAGVVLSPSAK